MNACRNFEILHSFQGCPNQCNGKGRCVNSTCVCSDGWSGDKCDIGTISNKNHNKLHVLRVIVNIVIKVNSLDCYLNSVRHIPGVYTDVYT